MVVASLDIVRSLLMEMGSWHRACSIGEAEMCYCIVHDEDGWWRVFWMERGNRITLAEFVDEQDACLEFMGRAAGRTKVVEWLIRIDRTDLIDKVNPRL